MGGSRTEASRLSVMYPGYAFSPDGSALGLLYGRIDGLVGGAVFAVLYNLLVRLFERETLQTGS